MTIDQGLLICIGLGNIGCFVYAANVIKNMGSVISGQKELLDSIKTYKDILDPKHFKENLDLKLENQRLQFEKEGNKKIQEIINQNYYDTVNHFDKKQEGIVKSWDEMIKWITSSILTQYPTFASKKERDDYIKHRYPLSEEFLIELVDFQQTNISPTIQAP